MIACTVLEEVYDLNPWRDCNITRKIHSSLVEFSSACNSKTASGFSKRSRKEKRRCFTAQHSQSTNAWSVMKIIKGYLSINPALLFLGSSEPSAIIRLTCKFTLYLIRWIYSIGFTPSLSSLNFLSSTKRYLYRPQYFTNIVILTSWRLVGNICFHLYFLPLTCW